MNFQLSAIFGFAQLGKHTQTIEVLEAFESTLRHTDFELELAMAMPILIKLMSGLHNLI